MAVPLGRRVDAIGLVEGSLSGDALEGEGDQHTVVFLGQCREDRLEAADVVVAQIGKRPHPRHQQLQLGMGGARAADDLLEIAAQVAEILAPEHVVRTQLEHENGNG